MMTTTKFNKVPLSLMLAVTLMGGLLLGHHIAQVGAASGGDATFAQGKSAFAAGNKSEALALFKQSAEAGNPEAQYQLGVMYMKGWGVATNAEEAYRWFGRAEKSGNAQAKAPRALVKGQLDAATVQRIDASL
jgi:TPR repeat protein